MHHAAMAYNLGEHFEELIRRLRATGRYQNDSEILRAGLRLLEDMEFAPAALELELVKSLNSPVRPLEKNWAAKMKREARRLLNKARSQRRAA
jgi:putative addiction module CopG family antidote